MIIEFPLPETSRPFVEHSSNLPPKVAGRSFVRSTYFPKLYLSKPYGALAGHMVWGQRCSGSKIAKRWLELQGPQFCSRSARAHGLFESHVF